jgi:hypothetical protein
LFAAAGQRAPLALPKLSRCRSWRGAVSDRATNVWLPVDTTLGPELARATDAALAPLAREARRIKWVTVSGAALLCVSALILAFTSDASGWSVAGVFSIVVAAIAFAIGLQKRKLWDGSPAWLRWYGRPITAPNLPAEANEILTELRAGTRHARYRRGGASERVELPFLLLRGPFGPLVLSTDPHVQGLALWNWFSGDRLGVEIEEAQPNTVQPHRRADVAAIENCVSAEGEDAASAPKSPRKKDKPFNALVLLAKADLDDKLRRTYPKAFRADCQHDDRHHRARVIVRTYQLANEMFREQHYATVTALRDDVVAMLRKEGIWNYGLSGDSESVSSSWMEKALAKAGYPAIEEELRLAAARDKAE